MHAETLFVSRANVRADCATYRIFFGRRREKNRREKKKTRELDERIAAQRKIFYMREITFKSHVCEVKQRRHSTAEDTLEYSSGEIYEISAFEEFESRITIAHGTYARIYIHTYIYMPMSNEPAKKTQNIIKYDNTRRLRYIVHRDSV